MNRVYAIATKAKKTWVFWGEGIDWFDSFVSTKNLLDVFNQGTQEITINYKTALIWKKEARKHLGIPIIVVPIDLTDGRK